MNWVSRFAAIFALLLPSLAIAGSTATNDTWRPGDTAMPYADFPFPVVADGEIWVPELKWQAATAIVPELRNNARPKMPDGNTSVFWLKQQKRHTEAVALIEKQLADPKLANLHPYLTQDLVNYLIGANSGYPQDLKRGDALLAELAMDYPQFFLFLGNFNANGTAGRPNDLNLAAHFYSKGLARGCQPCGARLLTMAKSSSNDFSATQDQIEAWSAYAADIGNSRQYSLLDSRSQPLGRAIRAEAKSITGSDLSPYGGIAIATQRRIRTGLVAQALNDAAAEFEKNGGSASAFGIMTEKLAYGRYRGYLLTLMLNAPAKAGAQDVGPPARRTFVRDAVRNGQLSFALEAAHTAAFGGSTIYFDNKGKVQYRQIERSLKATQQFIDVADRVGLSDDTLANRFQAEAAANDAKECWDDKRRGEVYSKFQKSSDQQIRNWAIRSRSCLKADEIAIAYGGLSALNRQSEGIRNLKVAASNLGRASQARIDQWLAEKRERSMRRSANANRSNSYLGSVNSAAPRATVSSAQAAENAKKAYCSGSEAGTRFCQ